MPKHIPVTWWPKTDSVSHSWAGWADDALPSRHEQLAGPGTSFRSPSRRDIDPVQPGADYTKCSNTSITQPNRRLQRPPPHRLAAANQLHCGWAATLNSTARLLSGPSARIVATLELDRAAPQRPIPAPHRRTLERCAASAAHQRIVATLELDRAAPRRPISPHRRHWGRHLGGCAPGYRLLVLFRAVALRDARGASACQILRNSDSNPVCSGCSHQSAAAGLGQVTQRSGLRVNAAASRHPANRVGWTLIR